MRRDCRLTVAFAADRALMGLSVLHYECMMQQHWYFELPSSPFSSPEFCEWETQGWTGSRRLRQEVPYRTQIRHLIVDLLRSLRMLPPHVAPGCVCQTPTDRMALCPRVPFSPTFPRQWNRVPFFYSSPKNHQVQVRNCTKSRNDIISLANHTTVMKR